jgi:O-antigen ligase
MSKASTHSVEMSRANPSSSFIDPCVLVAVLGIFYSLIVQPLMFYNPEADQPSAFNTAKALADSAEGHLENKLFWPAVALISICLAARNSSRLRAAALPSNIICLVAYLAFAGATVFWAFKPEVAFVRFFSQVMVVTATVLPVMLSRPGTDTIRVMFLCFAIGSFLNVFFVFDRPIAPFNNEEFGFKGYFTDKNALGQFAAIGFLLALNEILHAGFRRVSGIIVIIVMAWLVLVSKSKTSFALALFAPLLAGLVLSAGRMMRVSSATVLLAILGGYEVFSIVSGFSMNRVSYFVFGNANYSGRIFIWYFLESRIAERPLLGWGYQSFWLVGADGPSLAAGGWIGQMPHGHNGYLDVRVETGYVGFLMLLGFLITTLYAIGRVADRNFGVAWMYLTLAYFVMFDNFLESVWMRGPHTLWLVFLIVAAQAARDSQSFPPATAGTPARPMSPGPLKALRRRFTSTGVPWPRSRDGRVLGKRYRGVRDCDQNS